MRKACERCREKKISCDGNFPCSACMKSSQTMQAALKEVQPEDLFPVDPSPPEDMCVRSARKPMQRKSSRTSMDCGSAPDLTQIC
jgi:hypothetical protein